MSHTRQCARFREDGSTCTNKTDYADGWCRQADCPGFVRPDPARAPTTLGAPYGTAKHIGRTGAVTPVGITVEDVPDVRVTTRAADSFRFHHGGGEREAEVQLRGMLEDFLLQSARRVTKGGYLRLARQGYRLALSPDRFTITAYDTVHRERTWEQVKAGVRSRVKGGGKARTASGPAPEPGAPLNLADFAAAFDPATVHLTARVRTSYAKIAGLKWAEDADLDAGIRAAATEFRPEDVVQRPDGCFEVHRSGRTWLVAPDCRSLFGVKNAAEDSSVPGGSSAELVSTGSSALAARVARCRAVP